MSKYLIKQFLILSPLVVLGAFQTEPGRLSAPEYPDTRFIVFSDPHYYNPELGTEGKAFEEYLDNDRKLLKESEEILQGTLDRIKKQTAEFVIIPGDLTKDGTLKSHQKFAEYLSEIEKMGKKVFVVPGNHDTSNPKSYSYRDSLKIKVENVEPGKFKSIYGAFGYQEALYADSFSLSYIVEPVDGIWLFALDACRYDENYEINYPVTGGKFKVETLQWIQNMLNHAVHMNKAVIGFMHHGVLEHYERQSKFFEDYVVQDFKKVSALFAAYGMRMVFTGHYHAQDITSAHYSDNSFIFDIETGSLVTYPCPLRTVAIKNNTAEISSQFITDIPSNQKNFPDYARNFVWSGVEGIARETLIGFKLKEAEAELLSGQVANAFVAHYTGDEQSPEKPFILDGVSLKGRFLIGFRKKLVWNLWNDLPPADNEVLIDLSTGKVINP
ncbi:MAG: metallophosphoesterase family protein [Bacteroidales bacterium]